MTGETRGALTRAETVYTMYRADNPRALPGIIATLEDGVGREVGFWVGDPGWGYSGRTIGVYANGRNGQTSVSVAITPTEARALAASLSAMADRIDAGTVGGPVEIGGRS